MSTLTQSLPLAIVALLFAGMGLLALVRPPAITAFFGVRLETADGRNEVRAVYGGFGLAMGLALLLALRLPAWHDGVVASVGLALAGMAGGRLLSAVIERPGFWPWFFCALETAGAALLFAQLR